MGLGDRLKDLKIRAADATAEHSDKIHAAVEKAATTADQRTGGKYHERIQQAGAKADNLIEGLKGSGESAAPQDAAPQDAAPQDAAAQDADAQDADAPPGDAQDPPAQ